MNIQEESHIEWWTNSIFPLGIFERFMQESLNKNDLKTIFTEKKLVNWLLRTKGQSILSIGISNLFYAQYIVAERGKVLFDILENDLIKVWEVDSDIREEDPEQSLSLYPNKYEIFYCAKNNVQFHFTFPISMNYTNRESAYEQILNLITLYENQDDGVLEMIDSVLSEKDQMRYFHFNPVTASWKIIDPLEEITIRINDDFYKNGYDKRITKPHIVINEEKFDQYFIIKQQWECKIENKHLLIMNKPNDINLYLSIADKSLLLAKPHYENALKYSSQPYYNRLLSSEATTRYYDYFEHIITALIFSYTALEAFANICIIEGRTYQEKGKGEVFTKEDIEHKHSLTEKLKYFVREILSTPDPTKEAWWQTLIDLEALRKKFTHPKDNNSEEKYSYLLTKKVFSLIEVSKTIIAFYGPYIDNNEKRILKKYPYGFGFEGARPLFMSNEDFTNHQKDIHGIPRSSANDED